jgi:hypothetical protein
MADGLFRELKVTIGDAQAIATFGKEASTSQGDILHVLLACFSFS